jgi:phytanoyl-CoA hydroxylase
MNSPKAPSKVSFDTDGYVAVRGFLGENDLATVHGNVDRYIREIVPKLPPEHVFYEDKQRPETLKQLQVMNEHDAYFRELFMEGPFVRLAEKLLGDRAVGKNLQYFNKPPQYFNKPPGVGQPTPAHQDGYYFKLDPPEALTMWLALDEVDEENGCVRYVRGSHLRGMRPHARTNVLGFSQGITDYGTADDMAGEIAFPAHPGDLLAHHALTIHRADGNRSTTRSRRSLGFIYFAASARVDEVTVTKYQQQLKDELIAANKL